MNNNDSTLDIPVLFTCQRTFSSVKAIHERGYLKRRVHYYNNSMACFTAGNIFLVNFHPNPGPTNDAMCSIKCLYLNARNLTNKTDELQTLAADVDLIAVTETWLKSNVLNSEILPGNDFSILRRDIGKAEQEAG